MNSSSDDATQSRPVLQRHRGFVEVMSTLRDETGGGGFQVVGATRLRYGKARCELRWQGSVHELHLDFEADVLSLRMARGDEMLQSVLAQRADELFGARAGARNRAALSSDTKVRVRGEWNKHGFVLVAQVLTGDYMSGTRQLLDLSQTLLHQSPSRGLGTEPSVRRLRVS